jgi:hypothetical protein
LAFDQLALAVFDASRETQLSCRFACGLIGGHANRADVGGRKGQNRRGAFLDRHPKGLAGHGAGVFRRQDV